MSALHMVENHCKLGEKHLFTVTGLKGPHLSLALTIAIGPVHRNTVRSLMVQIIYICTFQNGLIVKNGCYVMHFNSKITKFLICAAPVIIYNLYIMDYI